MDPNHQNFNGGVFAIGGIFYLAIIVIVIVGMWKTFEKAGKPGWASIIPIYNLIVLMEIIGKPIWWLLLWLIPCVNFVFIIWTYNLLSKSFGQKEGFTVGLLLLPFVFFPLLGFGNYQYLGPSAAEAKGLNSLDPNNYKNPFDKQNPSNPLNPGNNFNNPGNNPNNPGNNSNNPNSSHNNPNQPGNPNDPQF